VLPVEHRTPGGDAPAGGWAQPGPAAGPWTQAGANGSAPAQVWTDPSAGRLLLQPHAEGEPAREFVLNGHNVTIGRAPACTVSLPDDPLVSRLHAVLHYDADRYTISDLGSSNGTLVNGTAIQGVTPLAEGDRITVGQHVLIFTQTPGRPTAAAYADGPADVPVPQGPPSLPPMPDAPNWEALLAQNDGAEVPGAPGGATVAAPAQAGAADETVEVIDAAESGDTPVIDMANAAQSDQETASAPPASDAIPPVRAGDQTVETGPRTGQLEALRTQIVETSAVLARWTETTAQNTKRLRAGLADVAGLVAAALTAATGDSAETSAGGAEGALRNLEALIEVAEQAANDPHHVNALVALAGRSGDIVTALRIQQHLIDQLVLLRDRLDALARQEGW
jgi:pSer/pThr/pTyr-binding forkhead associated (FHA) protein